MHIGLSGWFWSVTTVGSGQYVYHLLHHLVRLAPEHTYTLYLARAHGERTQAAVPKSVRVRPVRTPFDHLSTNVAKVWFEQFSLPRALLTDGADLLHVPYWGSPLWPPVPTVVTIHDLIPMLLPAYRGNLLVRAYTSLVAAAARRANLVLTDSQAARADILRHLRLPPERVYVVPLAVDARYRPVTDADHLVHVRGKYRLPARYLLYLGGFDQRKNLLTLLEAYATWTRTWTVRGRAQNSAPGGVPLVIAGVLPDRCTPLFPDLRTHAEALRLGQQVHFIGWVEEEDKPALYTMADAFVFPSLYEGFGLPVLEAMACGTPVIAANTTSLPELVGDAGLLVSPHDVAGLAEAMDRVVRDRDLREHLGVRARERAQHFTWEQVVRATADAYRRVGIVSTSCV